MTEGRKGEGVRASATSHPLALSLRPRASFVFHFQLVQKRRHMRCGVCARFLSVASFRPPIGRSPQLTSTMEHQKTVLIPFEFVFPPFNFFCFLQLIPTLYS